MKIELVGHTGTQAPQSMQPSGSTYSWVAASKRLLVLLGVDAVGRASVNAKLISGTGISDDVCHDDDLRFGVRCRPYRAAVAISTATPNVQRSQPFGGDAVTGLSAPSVHRDFSHQVSVISRQLLSRQSRHLDRGLSFSCSVIRPRTNRVPQPPCVWAGWGGRAAGTCSPGGTNDRLLQLNHPLTPTHYPLLLPFWDGPLSS